MIDSIWPEKITEFLDFQDSNSGQLFIRYGNCNRPMSVKLVNSLLDDHSIPKGIQFSGCITRELNLWTEHRILYRIEKISNSAEYLGEMIIALGKMIMRLSRSGDNYDFGIQELDPTRSDGYYILIYALEEV